MHYNICKYKTLLAIKECNEIGIPATSYLLSVITGLDMVNQKRYVSSYYRWRYLDRKIYQEKKRFRGFQYTINKKGESALEKYSERFINGYDLNIRRMPQKVDWSGIELLPGLHVLDELKEKKMNK